MNARIAWPERNRDWLVRAIGQLRARFEAPAIPAHIDDITDSPDDPDFTPALLHCARAFSLTPFERELLLLVAGLELDPGLRAAVQARNGGASTRASLALALGWLTQPHWDALSNRGPLRHWLMIEAEAGLPLTQAALHLDERILHFITGVAADDLHLLGIARNVPAMTDAPQVDQGLRDRTAGALATAGARGAVVVLQAEAPDAAAERDLALAVAASNAVQALWIDARHLPANPAELALVARRVDREVALTGALPVLSLDAAGAGEAAAVAWVDGLRSPLLWLGAAGEALASLPQARPVVRIALPTPDALHARAALLARWRAAGGTHDAAVDAALARAAAQFHLGPGAIDATVTHLQSVPAPLRADAVWAAARAAARGGLDALCQRVVTRARFDDLVLPPAQLAALRDIAAQLNQRERVQRDWGFGALHPRGQGLTALFTGESGTGKTLAAEAIANEVGLDLYRIDLAATVSKYIGETEKNLKRLFDAAEASGAVLLFDEADALFGKRSEVRDSHDRYANIEVAYLLQRVESYRGLAILTTNMKSALDRAFMRRLRFVLSFPFPDAAAREQIWRRQFPAAAPLGALQFPVLAGLRLAGGNIHSVVLNAAFKAAADDRPIDQATLLGAARAEFAKLERNFHEPAAGAVPAKVAA